MEVVALVCYTALIAWIALNAIEAEPVADISGGLVTGVVTVLWLGGSIALGLVWRRWTLLGLPAAVTTIALVYGAFETNGYDLPLAVENEVWAASLLIAFALESFLVAIGIAVGQRRRRA